jgi:hypothetical protein
MISIQLSDTLWDAGKFVLSASIGAAIVVMINHFKQRYNQRIQLKNDIYSLFCKFFFISSIQYSELINKKKEIEAKLKKIETLTEPSPKEDFVYIVQDFDFDVKIAICISDLSDTLFKLKSMTDYQSGDAQMGSPPIFNRSKK